MLANSIQSICQESLINFARRFGLFVKWQLMLSNQTGAHRELDQFPLIRNAQFVHHPAAV